MAKFLIIHTLPPGGISEDQLKQMAQASQADPVVKGYRSFSNLSEGKAVCVFDGPNKEAVGAWFDKMGVPYDSITHVELEGDRGEVRLA